MQTTSKVDFNLFLKYINNELSYNELKLLYAKIKKSESDKNELSELKNSYALAVSKLAPDYSLADFNQIIKEITDKAAKSTKFTLRKLYRYASVILFPVFFAVSVVIYYTSYTWDAETAMTEVIAPPKHSSHVILPDGSNVWLNPESSLKYSQDFGQKSRVVILEGEGYFEIDHNPLKPFVVHTDRINVKVLGTSFNLEAYSNENLVKTTLVRGALKLEDCCGNNLIYLEPGDHVIYNSESSSVSVEQVNADIYKLIKEGVIIFKRNNLSEICKRLERWFMIPVEYYGQADEDLLLTAKFEDETLMEILRIVGETIPIEYTVHNDKVVIRDKK